MKQEVDIRGATVETLLRTLGQRLRQAKRRCHVDGRRMTDTDLARLSGVSRSTITRLWRGLPVTLDNVVRIVRALDRFDLLYPLFAEDEPTPLERLAGPLKRRARPRRRPVASISSDDDDATAPLADPATLRQRYGERAR